MDEFPIGSDVALHMIVNQAISFALDFTAEEAVSLIFGPTKFYACNSHVTQHVHADPKWIGTDGWKGDPMITMQKISKTKDCKVKVTFKMPSLDGCSCLYLLGTFKSSNESVYRMQHADDGTWSLTLELESGRDYQYRFRTDNGIWHADPAAKSYVPNQEGAESSVVHV